MFYVILFFVGFVTYLVTLGVLLKKKFDAHFKLLKKKERFKDLRNPYDLVYSNSQYDLFTCFYLFLPIYFPNKNLTDQEKKSVMNPLMKLYLLLVFGLIFLVSITFF